MATAKPRQKVLKRTTQTVIQTAKNTDVTTVSYIPTQGDLDINGPPVFGLESMSKFKIVISR